MNLNKISLAVALSALPITSVFAAALERSNQSISAFLEPGNYIEAGFNVTDMNIEAKTTSNVFGNVVNSTRNSSLGSIGHTYLTPKVAIKTQINDQFSVGILYDQPFAIDTNYSDAIRYMGNTQALAQSKTQFKIDTKDITLLFGYKPTDNFTVFAGPTYQTLDGTLRLRGGHQSGPLLPEQEAYSLGRFDDESYGWLAGLAFNSDSNKLKSSITYRSENTYKFKSEEESRITHFINLMADANAKNKITLPQSVNIETDYQITSNTNIGAFARWINWKNFEMNLPYYTTRAANFYSQGLTNFGHKNMDPLIYKKDQWSLDLNIDQKLNDKWDVSGLIGWDSGAGDYISNYTPINGSWKAGVAVKFSPAKNYFVQTGLQYIWLDNVKGQHSKQLATNSNLHDTEFNDSYALSYDFKIGYRF